MICSEARTAASQANGAASRGPLSPESRAISARNSLKHGLTGKGLVTPERDQEEIARRSEALTADMQPRSEAGLILILQMAMLSVRMERAAEYESAAIARGVRHAADDHDEARIDQANELFKILADDPRNNLRKLRKSPEGVERLIEGWRDLRADLTAEPASLWADEQLEQAALLSGTRARHARGSRLGGLSRGFWGDFAALGDGDGASLDEESRRSWAKARILERIEAEVAGLEAHYRTLDFESIEADRAEAGLRALFDSSKEAARFRRYESEARRGFFRCLKEFRQVEAEFSARSGAPPSLPVPPTPASEMGSFREIGPPPDREPVRAIPEALPREIPAARRPVSQPDRRTRRPKLPR